MFTLQNRKSPKAMASASLLMLLSTSGCGGRPAPTEAPFKRCPGNEFHSRELTASVNLRAAAGMYLEVAGPSFTLIEGRPTRVDIEILGLASLATKSEPGKPNGLAVYEFTSPGSLHVVVGEDVAVLLKQSTDPKTGKIELLVEPVQAGK